MEVVHVMEPVESPELGAQVVQAMREVRYSMYLLYLLHKADFREFVNEHNITHGQYLLGFLNLMLSDPLYNV